MSAPYAEITKQISDLVEQYDKIATQPEGFLNANVPVQDKLALVSRMKAAILRTAPSATYTFDAERVASLQANHLRIAHHFAAILRAIRSDYETGAVNTIRELIHASLFDDFLEMASHLLAEGYKCPAAVLSGSVLEDHLRKLSDKNGLSIQDSNGKHLTGEPLNVNLAKAQVYNQIQQKQVTAWLGIRNSAAHGHNNDYSEDQVKLIIDGVRAFIHRFPA